jgi:acyl carrier protein
MTSGQLGDVPSDQALEDTVTRLVTATLGKKSGIVKQDEPLLSSKVGFDSFSLMELVLRLEDTFDLSIPDEDLDPDIFHSVKTIVTYLHDRLRQTD